MSRFKSTSPVAGSEALRLNAHLGILCQRQSGYLHSVPAGETVKRFLEGRVNATSEIDWMAQIEISSGAASQSVSIFVSPDVLDHELTGCKCNCVFCHCDR